MRPTRQFLAVFLLGIMILLPQVVSAKSAGVHFFDCEKCHDPTKTIYDLGVTEGNVCLQCHKISPPVTALNPGTPKDPLNPAPTGIGSGNFTAGDASNVLGNGYGDPSDMETSHNWAAPSDRDPMVGAEPPQGLGFASNYGLSNGRITCSRCHDPHGAYGTNPTLLRRGFTSANIDDMCTDCHRSWASIGSAAHGLLSHPMVPDYEAVRTNPLNAGKYNDLTAVDQNKGDIQLMADGSISCSTCHGVHFVDSNSSTRDGVLNSLTIGQGDGKLLRSDGRRSTVTTPLAVGETLDTAAMSAAVETDWNDQAMTRSFLCQTCHTYGEHGGHGFLGCLDCHSGHVPVEDGGETNYYVLRNNIEVVLAPTSGVGLPLEMINTATLYNTTTMNWLAADGSGYCQNCHTTLVGPHNGFTSGGVNDCGGCHSHDSETGSFSGSCNACHGYAPDQGEIAAPGGGGPRGYANDGTFNYLANGTNPKDESLTAHINHSDRLGVIGGQYQFDCLDCHNDFTTTHQDGNFEDVVFSNLAAIGITPTAYDTTGDGSCASIYCHSNGRVRDASDNPTGVVGATIPSWEQNAGVGGRDAITTCDACHDIKEDGTASTKSNSPTHQVHMEPAKAYTCELCHNDTATGNAIPDPSVLNGIHVNGTVDVVFDSANPLTTSALPPGDEFNTSNAVCGIYCHSDGYGNTAVPPDWSAGTGGACGDCHGDAPADTVRGGSHDRHVNDADGPQLSCDVCHPHDGSTPGVGQHIDGTVDADYSLCNGCHGATAGGTGADLEPDWGNPATVNCRTCHQGTLADFSVAITSGPTAPAKDDFDVTGHGADSVFAASPYDDKCESCHDTTLGKHFDGTSGDNQLTGEVAADSAFCQTCHTTKYAHFDHTGIGNSTAANACSSCHEPHGEGTLAAASLPVGTAEANSMLLATIGGRTVTAYDKADSGVTAADFFVAAPTGGPYGICQVCHDPAYGFAHYSWTAADGHNSTTTCTNCHDHDKDPAFQGVGDACNACHGSATSNAPNTGAHLAHTNFQTGDKDGGTFDVSECYVCHTGVLSAATAGNTDLNYSYDPSADNTGGVQHSDSANRLTELAASVGFNPADGTCSKACHQSSSADGFWSFGVTPADDALDCDACHYYGEPTSATDNTNAPILTLPDASSNDTEIGGDHNDHFAATADPISCSDCHTVPTDTGHITKAGATDYLKIYDGAIAVQDEATVTPAALNTGSDLDPGNPSCDNIACHNPSNDGHSATWITSGNATCILCHGNDVASGDAMASLSHGRHVDNQAVIGDNIDCFKCHVDETSGGTNMAHRDANVDIITNPDTTIGMGYNASTLVGAPYGTCLTQVCHAEGGDLNGISSGSEVKTPFWGDNSGDDCTICHTSPPASGDHAEHWAKSPQMTCILCHQNTSATDSTIKSGSNHLNATYTDFAPGGSYDGSAVTVGTYTPAQPSTCASVSCHIGTTPRQWAPPGACEACHLDLSYVGSTHTKHIDITTSIDNDLSECVICHGSDITTYTVSGGDGGSGNHRDGNTQLETGISNTTCANACHESAAGDGNWTDADGLNCTACHNGDGNNDGVLANAAPNTGAHSKHVVTQGMTCDNCHDAGTAIPANTAHISGLGVGGAAATNEGETLTFKATPVADNALVNDSSYDHAGNTWQDAANTCSNTYCHDPSVANTVADWDTDTASCDLCHGYDRNAGTTMSSGSHGQHLVASDTFGTTNPESCTACHPNNISNAHFFVSTGPTVVNQQVQIGGTLQIAGSTVITGTGGGNGQYSGEVSLPNTAYGTCGTTQCHNNGQGGAPNGYTWASTPSASCTTCHSNKPGTGTHNTHLDVVAYGPNPAGTTECNQCHNANANNTSMATRTTHINGNISFNDTNEVPAHGGIYPAGNGVNGDTTVTSCHLCHGAYEADGSTLNSAVPANTAKANWATAAGVSCESCHGDYGVADVGGTKAPTRAGSNYDTYGHGKALTPADAIVVANRNKAIAKACTECHDGASDHISVAALNRLQLMDPGVTDIDYAANPVDWCNDCHTFKSNVHYGNDNTAGGTSTDALNCAACHDPHGQGMNDAMIAGAFNGFSDRQLRSSYNVATFDAVCQGCHGRNAADTAYEVDHYNQGTNEAGHNVPAKCTDCHSHEDTTIFAPSGCSGCHGGGTGTTTKNYWPDGSTAKPENSDLGEHLTHMTALAAKRYDLDITGLLNAADSDAKQKALCEACHAAIPNDSDHAGTADTAQVFQVDAGFKRQNLVGDADADATYVGGECNNVDCHNSKATTAANAWNAGVNLTGSAKCLLCHTVQDIAPGASSWSVSNPWTGVHFADQAGVTAHNDTLGSGCVICHDASTAYGYATTSTHINGTFIDESDANTDRFLISNLNYTDAAINTPTCMPSGGVYSASCHSDGGAWARLWSQDANSAATTLGSNRCNVCHGQLGNWRTGMTPNHDTTNGKIDDGTHGNCSICHVTPDAPYDAAAFATYHDSNSPLGSPTELSAPGHAIEVNDTVGYDMTNGNCTNICHTNDAAHTLGTSSQFPANGLAGPNANCGTCHYATGGSFNTDTIGGYTFSNRVGAHGQHARSVANTYGATTVKSTDTDYDFDCGVCHPVDSNLHINGTLNVLLTPTSTGAAGTIKALNDAGAAFSTTCSGVYCHSDGVNVAASTTPAWYNAVITTNPYMEFSNPNGDYCQNCHDNQPTTGAHESHVVGIHWNQVYSGTSAVLGANNSTGGHGNINTSTTINCNLCHSETLTTWRNDNNRECVGCHGGEGNAIGRDDANLKKTKHVDGNKQVVFTAATMVKSKSQLRDNIFDAPEVGTTWKRFDADSDSYDPDSDSGYDADDYKNANGLSHDVARAALVNWTKPNCTVACHNNKSVSWAGSSLSCQTCHSTTPK